MPTCDVIIPTFNNRAVLPQTLLALCSQPVPKNWLLRLIISDDGSTDGSTDLVVPTPTVGWRPPVIVRGGHTGPAGARNRALSRADADVILLLGADIILRPGALTAHLTYHQNHPQVGKGALGVIKWDPRIRPTPLMEWMMHGGQQNNYDALLGSRQADPQHFFYAAQVSIKTELIGDDRFADELVGYGWEDLELGRRLASRGLTLAVLHQALGLHHHFYSARDIWARQYQVGRAAAAWQRLRPVQPIIPQRARGRRAIQQLLQRCGALTFLRWWVQWFENKKSFPRLYLLITASLYWQGVENG